MLAAAMLSWGSTGSAHAQDMALTAAPADVQPVYLDSSSSPFGATTVTNADAGALEMPVLAFATSEAHTRDFDKYFYFHRANTDFATAYADIAECDGYARSLRGTVGYVETPYPYMGTAAGAVGGAIGNVMAQMIFGSAELRKLRRENMRMCMHYKGYQRHGLPKDLWQAFHFEEGNATVKEDRRIRDLKLQALVASSATPTGEGLGL